MDDALLFKGRFALTAVPGRFATPQAAPIHKINKKRFIAIYNSLLMFPSTSLAWQHYAQAKDPEQVVVHLPPSRLR